MKMTPIKQKNMLKYLHVTMPYSTKEQVLRNFEAIVN